MSQRTELSRSQSRSHMIAVHRGMWEIETRDSLHHLDLRHLDAPMWRRQPQRPDRTGRSNTDATTASGHQ